MDDGQTPPSQTNFPPFRSVIGDDWEPATDRLERRENPGRSDDTACLWCPADATVARRAMDAAEAAFQPWAAVPLTFRAERIAPLLDAILENEEDLAKRITRENGKTMRESRAEVSAALRDAAYTLNEARSLGATDSLSPEGAEVRSEVMLEPVGVQLLITPWNFPLATIVRKIVPALVYGNTVVVKPSELTPGPASLLFELMGQLGLPAGIASLVLGFGPDVGPPLAGHPALRGISFTGSVATGNALARETAGRGVRLQLEMGGKNSLVVLADASIDDAVDAAVTGAFSCAGQWCTGTGRAIVEAAVHDEFVARLAERAGRLRIGPGDVGDSEVGPVVSAARVDFAKSAVEAAVAAGARVRCGGRSIPGGHFFQPTVLENVTESMAAFLEELFVPVLPVVAAQDAADAVRLANAGPYGLSASVFSSDVDRASELARRIEAGIVHVNLHTAYREPALPVAAWRDSGFGPPECGRFYRDFFTRPRAVYVRK